MSPVSRGFRGHSRPTDLDPTFEQVAPRGLEVGDDEIDVVK
jgi:hypothetical protein